MKVMATASPAWINQDIDNYLNSDNFNEIIVFFVIKSPCKTLSARKVSLQEYGWRSPWRKPYYLNKQLKKLSNSHLLYSSSTHENMSEAMEKADLYEKFPSDLENERICINDSQKNQFMSTFYHIRNSFAHGRFSIYKIAQNKVYVFEDISRDAVTARMILKESTLLHWIQLIKAGERIYTK